MAALDFTSALYLGLRHPTHALPPWKSFTTGKPAGLEVPPLARRVAMEAARLQGCEAGIVAASTLHLFWDVMGMLARKPVSVLLDSGAYPIANWGAERARLRGARVRRFSHGNVADLRGALEQNSRSGLKPVVVADAVSVWQGQALPMAQYLEAVRRYRGLLVIDNTQALGLLGASPTQSRPYGSGGGGTLPYTGARGKEVVVISSLAKAFGAPLAVLAGSREFIAEFGTLSETRDHCSPPSTVALLAAQHALIINARMGKQLRDRLLQRVGRLRSGLAHLGIHTWGEWFPVQTLVLPKGSDAVGLHAKLLERGIRTVLLKPRSERGPQLAVILRADHDLADIDCFCRALKEAMPRLRGDACTRWDVPLM
jgi:8-amino-7-oxononanoate synthase